MRAEHIVDSSLRIARAAAELAQLLGAAGEPEQRLIAARAAVDPSRLPVHELGVLGHALLVCSGPS